MGMAISNGKTGLVTREISRKTRDMEEGFSRQSSAVLRDNGKMMKSKELDTLSLMIKVLGVNGVKILTLDLINFSDHLIFIYLLRIYFMVIL